MLKRTIATVFVAALLCLVALPVTALAAAPSGQVIYVGNENVTSGGYWTTDSAGTVTAFTGEGTPADKFIHYDADNNVLTLRNATIKKGLDYNPGITGGTYIFGSAIGVFNEHGNAELTIKLEGTNTIAEVSNGIYVLTTSSSASNATLTIEGDGSLDASASQTGIWVQGNSCAAALKIENAKVTATLVNRFGTYGVFVQSAENSSASLTVDGGSLTATGNDSSGAGIHYQFGSNTGSGTPSLTVSGNTIVRANGGISDSSSADIQIEDGNNSSGGIVFDDGKGTVYGEVTLQTDLEIGEDESLKLDDGASLNAGGHNVIVDGGTVDESLETSLGGSVKYAPSITTTSLPNGTVGTSYNQTLAADGTSPITWSVASGSLPTGLSLNGNTITGTPTTAGESTFTVKAESSYGSDSREYTLTIDPKQTVSVTGVTLSATSLTLTEKETATLTATVEPTDATNQKVTWSSSASGVATVDANGNVTAVGAGTAIITVTTADGGKTATCTVTVEHDPASEWSSDAGGHWHACEACDDKLDHAAHAPKVEGALGATCTEDGYTGDTVCSVCGYEISKGESVPAAGHEYEDDGHCVVCDGIDPGFSPKIIAGADSTWQKGSEKNLTVTSNAAYEDFREVRLDGKAVDQKHFHVAEGSTVITLKASFLETLKLGSHELEIMSTTGTVKTTFAVTEGKANETIVPTGDSPLSLLGSVAAIALGVVTILCGRALSREHQRP